MSELYPILRNERGRIRCYSCKHDQISETGPWAIRREHEPGIDGRIAVCYDHSDLPLRKLIEELNASVSQNTHRTSPTNDKKNRQ